MIRAGRCRVSPAMAAPSDYDMVIVLLHIVLPISPRFCLYFCSNIISIADFIEEYNNKILGTMKKGDFMEYFLKKTKNKKGTYLQICESYYNPERKASAHRSYKPIHAFSLDQIYSGLGYIGSEYEKIIEIFQHQASKKYKFDTSSSYE